MLISIIPIYYRISEKIENEHKNDINKENPEEKEKLELEFLKIEERFKSIEKCIKKLHKMLEDEENNEHQNIKQNKEQEKSASQYEDYSIKGKLNKFEYMVNDLTLRLTLIENALSKLEPNIIKELMENIAEPMIKKKHEKVEEEMTYIKGSQYKSCQMVDSLEDRINNIDEKINEKIGRKVERKELAMTKLQVSHKVVLYYM